MENHFNCIYLYTNKINGKKYVGQAVDFIKRHKQHIYQAYNEKHIAYNQYFHNAIRRHGIENFEIEILKENLQNQEELNYWECYYIVEFDTLANNGKGYNLASGGSNGNSFAGKTEKELSEIRKKQSEAMKGKNPYTGKSKEEVAEISRKKSEANKGKNPYAGKTEEEMKEISRKISEKTKGSKNPRAKKVKQKDLNGNTIKIWDYAKQISKELGFNRGTLSYYLTGKGKGKPYKGYIWEYVE